MALFSSSQAAGVDCVKPSGSQACNTDYPTHTDQVQVAEMIPQMG